MDSATGWWMFWLVAALALYFGLVWALLHFGAASDADDDSHRPGGEGPAASDVASTSPGNPTEQGGKPQ